MSNQDTVALQDQDMLPQTKLTELQAGWQELYRKHPHLHQLNPQDFVIRLLQGTQNAQFVPALIADFLDLKTTDRLRDRLCLMAFLGYMHGGGKKEIGSVIETANPIALLGYILDEPENLIEIAKFVDGWWASMDPEDFERGQAVMFSLLFLYAKGQSKMRGLLE